MVEVGHFVLDPLWKCEIRFPEECSVIIVAERRQLKKVDEEPRCFVAVFHDERIKFCLDIRKGVIWAEVDEELLNE